MTQHTVRYVAEELEELVGLKSTEKAHKAKDKPGAHEGLGSWEVVDGLSWNCENTYLWLTATGQCEMQNRHEMMWDVQMATELINVKKEIKVSTMRVVE